MDGVTAIANILRMEGVEFIGCVPYQPLLEAAAIAGIRPIIFRQEITGVHMVDGYSRATNGKKIGVFMMQNGPGAENGFGGVAQAFSESVPILLLPAGMSRDKRGVHPNFYPTRSYETITKWSDEFNMVERIPSMMRRAFTKLRSGRPGPVLLEIPADVATAELPEELFDYESPRSVLQQADPADVSRAAAALLAAERPVIQAGQGVLYAEATDELVELAEFLQAPVMTTLPGKSAFPENHPLALGAGGPATTAMVNKYLHGADTDLRRGRKSDQDVLRRTNSRQQDIRPPDQRRGCHRAGVPHQLPTAGRRQAGAAATAGTNSRNGPVRRGPPTTRSRRTSGR